MVKMGITKTPSRGSATWKCWPISLSWKCYGAGLEWSVLYSGSSCRKNTLVIWLSTTFADLASLGGLLPSLRGHLLSWCGRLLDPATSTVFTAMSMPIKTPWKTNWPKRRSLSWSSRLQKREPMPLWSPVASLWLLPIFLKWFARPIKGAFTPFSLPMVRCLVAKMRFA